MKKFLDGFWKGLWYGAFVGVCGLIGWGLAEHQKKYKDCDCKCKVFQDCCKEPCKNCKCKGE